MIGEKIVKIMEEIEPIVKTELDENGNYKTPKVEKIIEMIRPLLVKNKVAIIPVKVKDLTPHGNKVYLTMIYQFIDLEDEAKDCIEVEIPGSGYDEKSGRAVFSALTGAYRYAIQETLAIPIVDEIKSDTSSDENNEQNIDSKEENTENKTYQEELNENNNISNIDSISTENLDKLFSFEKV